MMSYSSCLADHDADILLDASVFINLSASGAASAMLQALPNRVLIVDVAASVQVDSKTGRSDNDTLQELLASPVILDTVTLDENGLVVFERLVLELDDGEAATIAAAAIRRSIAVLDERRARKICGEQLPDIVQASTIDLFAHPAIEKALGRDGLADAVHAALQNARMHVRADQRDWVIDLIGRERAANCNSIPRAHELRDA
jgi:predicted nucleic acid-binding protein